MRVLLVDPDPAPIVSLGAAGLLVDHVDAGEAACELVGLYDYDIVVLDLLLRDIDGFEVVRRMRAARIATPAMIVSGVSSAPAKVKALALGADDFVTKPCDDADLLARIRAIVRRSRGFAQPGLRIGPMTLDLDNHEVAVNGQPVHVTGKEYAILERLALRPGLTLTREALLSHLYGEADEPEMKIIDVFVCKLRRKLADAGAPKLINTVWGRGYRLEAAK